VGGGERIWHGLGGMDAPVRVRHNNERIRVVVNSRLIQHSDREYLGALTKLTRYHTDSGRPTNLLTFTLQTSQLCPDNLRSVSSNVTKQSNQSLLFERIATVPPPLELHSNKTTPNLEHEGYHIRGGGLVNARMLF